MLDDPARKVVDVALDLGYSDHAHFTCAFVRWTARPGPVPLPEVGNGEENSGDRVLASLTQGPDDEETIPSQTKCFSSYGGQQNGRHSSLGRHHRASRYTIQQTTRREADAW